MKMMSISMCRLQVLINITAAATRDGSNPQPVAGTNDQAEAIIRNDDGVPNLSVNIIADKGTSNALKNYADSSVPELNNGQSNNITWYVTADRINGKGSTGDITTGAASGGVPSTFTYFTTNGTAIGGTDYSVTNQTVIIPFNTQTLPDDVTDAGNNLIRGSNFLVNNNQAPRVPITVSTIGDNNDEGDETVNVTLQSVTGGNAIIDPNNATKTGTIDDDAPVASISDASVTEGDAGTVQMTFPVTLDAPSLQQVQIDYVTIDNTAVSETHGSQVQTVTFSGTPASGSYTLGVSVNGGPVQTTAAIPFNADETAIQTALLNLGNVGPTDIISVDLSNNILTVVFRNTLSRQFAPFVFTPNNLQDSSGQAVTATVFANPNNLSLPANFQAKAGRLTFPVGSTTQFITINIIGNTIPEGESLANRFLRFFVQISVSNNTGNPTFGLTFSDNQATGIINDDDSLSQLSFVTNLQTNEGNLDANGQPQVTTADFVVQLQGQSGLSVSTQYATADGTAKSDSAASSGKTRPSGL